MNENKDYLTGILNRKGLTGLYDELDGSLPVNMMFLDIDNFKTVNDMYGHNKGDEALICFAQILKQDTPEGAVVARLGGDEFIVMIVDELPRKKIETLAKKILADVKNLKKKDRAFEVISSSIGIVRKYRVADGLDGALSLSDKAMYYAKEQGKDTFVFYEDYEDVIAYENDIERSAGKALDEGRFIIKYHPMLHLASSRLVCTEACCIWEKEDGTVLGRNDYRPILAKNGFINTLDLYVFEQVCKNLSAIKKASKLRPHIGIQFSYFMLVDHTVIEEIGRIMEEYRVDPSELEINLDEHCFGGRASADKAIEGMKTLKKMGFSIALSRFGEDFSSVRYLMKLPLSAVKLDGEIIINNVGSEEGKLVLKSLFKMLHGFKVSVSACKVDDLSTMAVLSECGCDAATGDVFSDKLSLTEYLKFLKEIENVGNETINYKFNDAISGADSGDFKIDGENIEFVNGISEQWGAVNLPGGPCQTNCLRLPASVFDSDRLTFSMWIKPSELQNWVSALYVRCQNGFFSFMPNIAGGRCMLRIKHDVPVDEWHDAMTSGLAVGKWTFLTCTIDMITSVGRIYINGEPEAMVTDFPNLGRASEVILGGDVFQLAFSGKVSGFQINKGVLEVEEIRYRYKAFLTERGFCGKEEGNEIKSTEIIVHDPAIYEDTQSRYFYLYCTDGESYSSMDLLHWKSISKVVSKPLLEAQEWTESGSIWAPDIVKVGEEYRLYCSNSAWGVNRSCIFLAVGDSPKGPFVPKSIVVKSDTSDNFNAIDANIIEDHETGEQYMVYGSFWSGIYILQLDKETGLAKEDSAPGKLIAARPLWNDGSIEGPYIIYHPETEYYYLFVSYGSLTADYNIRVGRSKSITGPYLDYHGRDMVAYDDKDCSVGLMIACGYKYLTGQAYMAPGHNSVLLRQNGQMFLVNHIRKLAFNANPGPGLLQIRKMVMTDDGWPIALGQPYNAETLLEVRDALLYGEYERIELRPSVPQGIMHAHPMKLYEDGRLEMASVRGTWKRTGTFTMLLEYGPVKEFVYFEKGLDREKNKTSVIMCGLTSDGICTWATKEELVYQ